MSAGLSSKNIKNINNSQNQYLKNIDNIFFNKTIFKNLFFFIVTHIILAKAWGIFVIDKPFWLDEWFVLYSIKFATTHEIFDHLLYGQEFPRVYLLIIKKFSELFNFSAPSIKLIPFLVQTASLFLTFHISSKYLFKKQPVLIFLFFLLFTTNNTTFNYFSQIKQYSMDIFIALSCIILFYKAQEEIKTKLVYIPFILFPLLSQTYPIVVSPVLAVLLLKSINQKPQRKIFMIAITGLIIGYLLDYRLVMQNNNVYSYWNKYIVNYESIHSFISHLLYSFGCLFGICRVFYNVPFPSASNFYSLNINVFQLFHIFVIVFSTIGFIINSKRSSAVIFEAVKRKNFLDYRFDASIYFSIIFATLLFGYLIGKIPISSERISYFTTPMVSYFLVIGVSCCLNKSSLFGAVNKLIIITLTAILSTITLTAFINEYLGKASWYDDNSYKNYGKAIEKAQKLDYSIYILHSAAPFHWELIIKTHPKYDKILNMPVKYIQDNETFCKSNKLTDNDAIFIEKYSFNITSTNKFCQKN